MFKYSILKIFKNDIIIIKNINLKMSTFLENYFNDLPNDIQVKILTKVDFRPTPRFQKGDCVNLITNPYGLFFITAQPTWSSGWKYSCKNPKFTIGRITYFDEDRLENKQQELVKCIDCENFVLNTSKERCGSCGHNFCTSCYANNYNLICGKCGCTPQYYF